MFRVLLVLLLAQTVAAETIVKFGAQIPKGQEGLGGSKTLYLAYQNHFNGPFIFQTEGGFWIDNVGGGRKSASLLGTSLGVHVKAGYVFAQALTGPAVITDRDTILGGNLQINNDIAIGLVGEDGNTFGVAYKHISSAGLSSPNKGRDFIMFRVGIPF